MHASSNITGPEILQGLLEGRWVFEGGTWEGLSRIYRLRANDRPRPFTVSQRNVIALVARGATDKEAGYVLGLANTTVATYLAVVAKRLNAHVLDLPALGPLFEQMEQR